MKKSIVVLLHVGFWGCYLVLILVMLGMLYGREGQVDESRLENAFQIMLFFAVVPSAISFYSFYFLLFPRYLQHKKTVLSIVYGILISLGSAIIGYAILSTTVGANCGYEDDDISLIGVVLFMSFITLICGIIALVIQGFITWFGEIKLKEMLKQKNHEMELALVKSQLDPHFLFNTINNIDILILKNATEASNYLNKLSDIMRFMLFETKADTILLSKELEYIEKYIELQKIRTANLTYVNFQVTGIPANKTIAPMVFIPFIENAFKHTTNKKLENAITINIFIENETISLVCENKFNPSAQRKQENNGLGNDLIQKRLLLIYPEKHTLRVEKENGIYKVSLTIYHG
ncbi:MAG: sensor histidine kinase [Bacteroidota bacterium]